MSKEEIAYLSDLMPEGAAPNHVPVFSEDGRKLVDSTLDVSQIALKSEIASDASALWDAINNEYALGAYRSADWEPQHSYQVGDYCRHQKNEQTYGYRCKQANSGNTDFNENYWDVVLTPAGIAELDRLMDPVNQMVNAVDYLYDAIVPQEQDEGE